ncbi:MAG: hypothetical protein WCJ17_02215, partial [bacterium]
MNMYQHTFRITLCICVFACTFSASAASWLTAAGRAAADGRSRSESAEADRTAYQTFVETEINPYNLIPSTYYQKLPAETQTNTARRTKAWQKRITETPCKIKTFESFKRKSENADFINFSKLSAAYVQATKLSADPSLLAPFTTRGNPRYDKNSLQAAKNITESQELIANIFKTYSVEDESAYQIVGNMHTEIAKNLKPLFDTPFIIVSDRVLQNESLGMGKSNDSIITAPLAGCITRFYKDVDFKSLTARNRTALATVDTLIKQAPEKTTAQYPGIYSIWREYLADAYEIFLSSGITILYARLTAQELADYAKEMQKKLVTLLTQSIKELPNLTKEQKETYTEITTKKLMASAAPFTTGESQKLLAQLTIWCVQDRKLAARFTMLRAQIDKYSKERLETLATLTKEIPELTDIPELPALATELGRVHRVFAATQNKTYDHAALCDVLLPKREQIEAAGDETAAEETADPSPTEPISAPTPEYEANREEDTLRGEAPLRSESTFTTVAGEAPESTHQAADPEQPIAPNADGVYQLKTPIKG